MPPFDRWTVVRAEQYITSHPDRRLTGKTPADVDNYLENLGRKTSLTAWQFRQALDAIQKLFEFVGVKWLGEVDWANWRDSAHGLEAMHPTVARDYLPLPAANGRWTSPDLAGGLRRGLFARCTRPEIPECSEGLALAVRLSLSTPVHGPARWRDPSASGAQECPARKPRIRPRAGRVSCSAWGPIPCGTHPLSTRGLAKMA